MSITYCDGCLDKFEYTYLNLYYENKCRHLFICNECESKYGDKLKHIGFYKRFSKKSLTKKANSGRISRGEKHGKSSSSSSNRAR